MGLWVFVVLALLLALAAHRRARRLARRLDALNQSYWELRYDFTRLRSRVARLDPEQPPEQDQTESFAAPGAPPAPPAVSFVPLSSLKRKEP